MKTIKKIKIMSLSIVITILLLVSVSCDNNESCDYNITYDCQDLELNIGDTCEINNAGVINQGTINQFCECIIN